MLVEILSWEKLSTLSRFFGKLAGFSWLGSPVACVCVYVLRLERREAALVVVPSELQSGCTQTV